MCNEEYCVIKKDNKNAKINITTKIKTPKYGKFHRRYRKDGKEK